MKPGKASKKAAAPPQSHSEREKTPALGPDDSPSSSGTGLGGKRLRPAIKKTTRAKASSKKPEAVEFMKDAAAASAESAAPQKVQSDGCKRKKSSAASGRVAASKSREARGADSKSAERGKKQRTKPSQAPKAQQIGAGGGLSRRERQKREKRGVVYVGHLPVGFFEPQLKAFFGQFGEVCRVRLFRSRKNAHSKGYAFVEFALREVAEVAAQAMDKYRMFGRTLVCRLIEKGQVQEHVFSQCHKPFKHINWWALAAAKHNKPEGQLPSAKGIRAVKSRMEKKAKQLKALGIDLELPSLYKAGEGADHLAQWVDHQRREKKRTKRAAASSKTDAVSETSE